MTDLEALARQLYTQGTRSAPTWEQCGEATKEEWRKSAQRHAAGDPEWWSCKPPKSVNPQQQQEN